MRFLRKFVPQEIRFRVRFAIVNSGVSVKGVIHLLSLWRRIFIEPARLAPKHTQVSRNLFNIGIATLLVGWFFLSTPSDFRFAFVDVAQVRGNQALPLERVEGEWKFIGGRTSFRAGIVTPGSETFLATISPFSVDVGPEWIGRNVVGFVYPGRGIVHLESNGTTLVSVSDLQKYYKNRCLSFVSLIVVGVTLVVSGVLRQVTVIKAGEKKR